MWSECCECGTYHDNIAGLCIICRTELEYATKEEE
jgi:hypothetical protein